MPKKAGVTVQGFWTTVETVSSGLGITRFGPVHLLWLGAIALCILLLCRCSAHAPPARCRRIRRMLVGLLMADELLKHVLLLACGAWLPKYLPLHLCSMNIFVALIHEHRPGCLTQELLYATCLPGAVLALLFPTWLSLPACSFMSLHSFSVHGLLAAYPAVLLAEGSLRPNARNLRYVLCLYAALCPMIYCLNRLLGTNFLFLNRAAAGTPLALFARFLGTPGYLLSIPVLLALLWLCMYLPLRLRKARRRTS